MLAPRPARLRSQRDINLWRIPFRMSLTSIVLFGVTLVPDILDKYGIEYCDRSVSLWEAAGRAVAKIQGATA